MESLKREGDLGAGDGLDAARRKRAAVELIAVHGAALKQTARRYSLCADDAEDAYQRGLEILLAKAPSDRVRDLFGWSKTVVKHEALAIRRSRERLLGPPLPERDGEDWTASIPANGLGPAEQLERRELTLRSREALRTLKPAERRALTLLAEGYSYAEIGELTGFSRTKVNRCLAEGRERFRRVVASSEDGTRCTELAPFLSAFCDGETSPAKEAEIRAHLHACAGCRATVRAYKAAPAAVAALAPLLPGPGTPIERIGEFLLGLPYRLTGRGGGGGGEAAVAQAAATAGGGAGMTAMTKLLTACAATAVGTAGCVAAGVPPPSLDLGGGRSQAARVERVSPQALPTQPVVSIKRPSPPKEPVEATDSEIAMPESVAPESEDTAPEPVVTPSPAPAPVEVETPASEETVASGPSNGGAAGEFGP